MNVKPLRVGDFFIKRDIELLSLNLFGGRMEKNIYSDFVIYPQKLKSINGVNVTFRELDIIGCVINRRMADPSIPSILGINKRTVETHLRNITQKLRCTLLSLKGIIENSQLTSSFNDLYIQLVLLKQFKDTCEQIKKIKGVNTKKFIVGYADASLEPLLEKIKTFIFKFGLELVLEVIPPDLATLPDSKSIPNLIIVNQYSLTLNADLKDKCIDFGAFKSISVFILAIIERLTDSEEIQKLIHQFNLKAKGVVLVQIDQDASTSTKKTTTDTLLKKSTFFIPQKLKLLRLSILVVLVAVIWVGSAQITLTDYARSELYLPPNSFLLKRNNLLSLIQAKLHSKTVEPSINKVVICGIGGAGKTVLARMIGRQHKGIVWEFNSESETSLRAALKEFAFVLANSDTDRSKLKFIFSLTNVEEQSKQISTFVRNKLRKHSNWLMMFDNVDSFSVVHPYLPSDPMVWGEGNVIITSRNSQFPSIESQNVIKVDALSQQEALQLFSQVRWGELCKDPKDKQELLSFLDNIPACPLDVVIAANFLRQSPELGFHQYLDRLNDNLFQLERSELLVANGEYTQTRHDIISVSLQKLLGNPTFLQNMVLIGLLNSKNIPKPLLIKISDSASVERVLYEMKKYSLITEEGKVNSTPVFSMHRTIHSTLFNYVVKHINKATYQHLVDKAIDAFDSYIAGYLDAANYQSIFDLISHTESMLGKCKQSQYWQSVIELSYVNLLSGLPAHSVKVVSILERCLSFLESQQKITQDNSLRIARATSMLGDRYRSQSRFSEARSMLEKSVRMFESLSPDSIDSAKAYSRLGTLYRSEGNHKKAQDLFLKSVDIYDKYPASYHPIDKYISLGLNARDVGDYKTAIEYLTNNLIQVKDNNDPWKYWILSYLGTVYLDTGNYDKAWDCFQQADTYFSTAIEGQGEAVPYAWRLAYMGATQAFRENTEDALVKLQKSYDAFSKITAGREMHGVCFKVVLPAFGYAYLMKGEYEKAKSYFKESLIHFEKHYGKSHFQTARIIYYLGMTALKTYDLDSAETLLTSATEIFRKYKHSDLFIPLEALSDLYREKLNRAKQNNNTENSELFEARYKYFLQSSMDIAQKSLPIDSVHLHRLKNKLKQRLLHKNAT